MKTLKVYIIKHVNIVGFHLTQPRIYTEGSRFTTGLCFRLLVANIIVVKRVLFKWFKLR